MKTFTSAIEGTDGTTAELDAYLLENVEAIDAERRRPAVLILPGGGYSHLSPREGEPVAIRLLSYGYQAFVLRYSVAPSRYPVSLLQTAEAMRTIRANADAWHIDPDAIAICGFSAGGHLAGLFAENWTGPVLGEAGFAPADIKPNALILCYPVITGGAFAHRRSISTLLGPQRADDEAWRDAMSLERHVSADVPPSFIWTTATDEKVPAVNSMLFAQALACAGVPYELHVFSEGMHGVALATGETAHTPENIAPCAQVWPDLLDAWMKRTFPQALGWR